MTSPSELAWRGDPADIFDAFDPATIRQQLLSRINQTIPDWHQHAACAGEPIDVFFPALGQPTTRAKQICSTCTVQQDCLDEAISDPDLDHGIRGGMAARDRIKLRAQLRRDGQQPARVDAGMIVRRPRNETPEVRRVSS